MKVFSQDITLEKNPYIFPQFRLILTLIVYLKNQGGRPCTMVIPKLLSVLVWWPLVSQYAMDRFVLGKEREMGCFYSLQSPGFLKQNMGYCMI